MKKLAGILVCVISFCGCSARIMPVSDMLIGQERLFQKNYTIGQSQTAYIGQPVIKIKDFKVKRFKPRYYHASEDFKINAPFGSFDGFKDKVYPVYGETIVDDKKYTVLKFVDPPSVFGLLIDDEGIVLNKILNLAMHQELVLLNIHPLGLKFIGEENKYIDLEHKYQNFELIYGGVSNNSFQLSYRDFSPKNPLVPASFQNLFYDLSQNRIRYGDIIIEIHIATNERIEYTVISDGLEKIENKT